MAPGHGLRYSESESAGSSDCAFVDSRRTDNPNPEDITVPQRVYLNYIKHQIEDENACMELPLTILLMLSFSMLALLHLRQDLIFCVEEGISRDLYDNANFAFSHAFGHKDIMDAHSIGDFWSWVRLGFVPVVIQPTWSYSERYREDVQRLFNYTPNPNGQYSVGSDSARPIPIMGDYLHYNRIIGGIRFRQEVARSSEDSCKFPIQLQPEIEREEWLQWYGKPCMPARGEQVFEPDVPIAESFGIAKRTEWLFTDLDPLSTMVAQVVDMEDGCAQLAAKNRTECLCRWCWKQEPVMPWLTEDTQRVEISMATYNAEYGLISLTGVNFWFNRGSFIHKRIEVKSSWMDPLSTPLERLVPMLFCDLVWLASLLYITVSELLEVVRTIRFGEGKWHQSLLKNYFAFWNVVDWVSILVALAVVIFYAWLTSGTLALHRAFSEVVQAPRSDREPYIVLVVKFYAELEVVVYRETTFRMSLCIYPMMVMLRLFKSFAAQPRLAMVTDTMKAAYQDLLHFSIVFIGVSVCLCLCAVLLFGQDHEEFATFSRALHSCFRMMFGDWDWKPMGDVWRGAAMLWFWLFLLLLVVILLNMLLAMIMDNYMDVKKRSSHAITLGGQIRSMWRRKRQTKRKERVRLADILKWFLADANGSESRMMETVRDITPAFLLENIRGIPMDQALRTLGNAAEQYRKQFEEAFSFEDAVDPLNILDDKTRLVRDALFYVFDRVDYYDTWPDGEQQPEEEAEVHNAFDTVLTEDGAITDEVLDSVHTEVHRLSAETATVLAESIKRVDTRQARIEGRQATMSESVRMMQASLLRLRSEATALANRMQGLCHDQDRHPARDLHLSRWRRGLAGCVGPSCLDLSMATPNDVQESLLPDLSRSGTGLE